jgi:hypothetical protein
MPSLSLPQVHSVPSARTAADANLPVVACVHVLFVPILRGTPALFSVPSPWT